MNETRRDPFRLHRAGLAPFVGSPGRDPVGEALAFARAFGEEDFLSFLVHNNLAALWHDSFRLQSYDLGDLVSFERRLKSIRRGAVATYLVQSELCRTIDSLCGANSIPYVIFKGAQIRERVYGEPSLRTARDVDVLTPKDYRNRFLDAFKTVGFEPQIDPRNITHEMTLLNGTQSLDLHWEILRPGRLRFSLTEAMVSSRVRLNSFWVPDDDHSLLLMLVHPVFTEHLNSHHSQLVHLLDLKWWLEGTQVDWKTVCDLLVETGTRTAAWAMLIWFELMIPGSVPREIIKTLEPAGARRGYLQRWIERGSSTRLANAPLVSQLFFTLAVHDSPIDACRAVGGRLRSLVKSDQRSIRSAGI